MKRPPEVDCYHDFYRAKYTTEYLHQYCSRQDENGRTLRDRIIFDANIREIQKIDGI